MQHTLGYSTRAMTILSRISEQSAMNSLSAPEMMFVEPMIKDRPVARSFSPRRFNGGPQAASRRLGAIAVVAGLHALLLIGLIESSSIRHLILPPAALVVHMVQQQSHPQLPQPPSPPQIHNINIPRPPMPLLQIQQPQTPAPIDAPPTPNAISQPPPPPPPPAQTISASEANTLIDEYSAELRASAQAALQIPSSFHLMDLAGDTLILLQLAPDGQLISARIEQSSGFNQVDQLALATVHAARFPAFLTKMPQHPMTFALMVKVDP